MVGGLIKLSEFYRNQGKYNEAEALARRSVSIAEKNRRSAAGAINALTALYAPQRKYSEAEPLYKRALAMREALLGPALSANVNETLTRQ